VSNEPENREEITAPRWSAFFATMLIMQPNFPFLQVDLVTQRGSLRRLFDFACGTKQEGWRIDAQVVEGTLFLSRWLRSNGRFVNRVRGSGYGFGFEKACLRFEDEVKESSSHIRIVEYQLGSLRCVVQGEADGYLDKGEEIDHLLPGLDNQPDLKTQPNLDNRPDLKTQPILATQPGLNNQQSDKPKAEVEGLKVVRKGRLVSSSSIVEAKCSAAEIKVEKQEKTAVPQCWLSQTEHLRTGQHTSGQINEIKQTDLSPMFETWEKSPENQAGLRKLLTLLEKIKETTRESESGRAYLILDNKKSTEVLDVLSARDNSGISLSDEVKQCFWPRPT
jgi:hypothetical protein